MQECMFENIIIPLLVCMSFEKKENRTPFVPQWLTRLKIWNF